MKTKPKKVYHAFNINDDVWVKLTERGRECLRKRHAEIVAMCSGHNPFPYTPPVEDKDGWSRWQMWRLMQALGPYISHGGPPPFETTLRIELQPSALKRKNKKGGVK